MPHDIVFAPKKELLSYEEMLFIMKVLREKGIEKVRLTGGEPLARKNIMFFLRELSSYGFEEITLTTNGVLVGEYLEELISLGIKRINLSLDTLNKKKFHEITRRDDFDKVIDALDKMMALNMDVRMNAVVMQGINDDEINDLARLSIERPIGVRFIEEMPFDGTSTEKSKNFIDHVAILKGLEKEFPGLEKIADAASSTSVNYRIQGAKGTVGIIPAYSRTFCASCNRIRLTSFGELKTCLYEGGGVSIRDIIRANPGNEELLWEHISKAISAKYKDGFEAEKADKSNGFKKSMSLIGG
jgi:cyclic pyranopterin phosphate synthase